ncbi:MAG: 4-(cytidine 5'-diphospho)-2-C-methyl-D-erythritol kinase [Gemmatimonadota bacterium]|nr:4-(cytidine 5'-diphospho)-2-C-methyl-D-erythritol kinase [Gemmatimonadota bacterium]
MTATAASVEAQAKVNLFLHVLAREEGGYHQLETLFTRIDLADSVRVRTDTSRRGLTLTGADTGPMERNVAYRAAEAFQAETGWPRGFSIEIEKRIPVRGGLGGGSADAGAVLRALNALSPEPLAEARLATIALALGADVPFFATDLPLAIAWGRGERLLGLRSLPAREVVLCVPPFGVETASAFAWMAEARKGAAPSAPAPLTIDRLDRWDEVARLSANDLEGPVIARHPELGACLESLGTAGARIARMSGSGSTVFGVFERRAGELVGLPAGVQVVHTRTATSVPLVRVLD